MVGRYLGDPGEGVAAAGVRGAAAVVDALAPVLDAAGWAAVVEALLDAVADDPLAALAPETSGTATCPHHENSFTGPIICESNVLFLASACCIEFGTGGKPLSELASPLPGSFQIFFYQETDRNDKRARTRTHTNDVQIPLVWLLYAGAVHKRYLPLQQEAQEQRLLSELAEMPGAAPAAAGSVAGSGNFISSGRHPGAARLIPLCKCVANLDETARYKRITESPTKVGDIHFWVSDVFTIPCLSRQLHCAVVTP